MLRWLAALVVLLVSPSYCAARTWHILPDGTGDAPTIQAGVDSAAVGDTVEVACGTYFEYDIALSSNIVLRSESMTPNCAMIDAAYQGRVLRLVGSAEVVGLTLAHGLAAGAHPDYNGGGAYCTDGPSQFTGCHFVANVAHFSGGAVYATSDVTFVDCSFDDNVATNSGGAFAATYGSHIFDGCLFTENVAETGGGGAIRIRDPGTPLVTDCTFDGNQAVAGGALHFMWNTTPLVVACQFAQNSASVSGGAIFCGFSTQLLVRRSLIVENTAPAGGAISSESSSPTVQGCTIASNEGFDGSAFQLFNSATHLDSTIVVFNFPGRAVACVDQQTPLLSCSDLYGNAGGDWVGCVAGQAGAGGNFSAAPLFCDFDNGDFHLQLNSPCAPGNSNGCGLVGAFPVGCGPVAVEAMSWGKVKGAYR